MKINKGDIFYDGVLLEQSFLETLPDDVLKWLEFYNSLRPDIQGMVNFRPSELNQGVPGKLFRIAADNLQAAGSDTNPPTAMYNAGGQPLFNKDYWNHAARVRRANCYAYAMNVIVTLPLPPPPSSHKLQPGEIRNISIKLISGDYKAVGNEIAQNAVDDAISGLVPGIINCVRCPDTAIPGPNQYKIALVVAPWPNTNDLADYHWYKRQGDGIWSHKPGGTEARETDGNGKIINDRNTPKNCNRSNGDFVYTEFVGYFMVTHT